VTQCEGEPKDIPNRPGHHLILTYPRSTVFLIYLTPPSYYILPSFFFHSPLPSHSSTSPHQTNKQTTPIQFPRAPLRSTTMPPKKKPAGPENGDTKVGVCSSSLPFYPTKQTNTETQAFRWTLENEKRVSSSQHAKQRANQDLRNRSSRIAPHLDPRPLSHRRRLRAYRFCFPRLVFSKPTALVPFFSRYDYPASR
jgi:hypothetical protein